MLRNNEDGWCGVSIGGVILLAAADAPQCCCAWCQGIGCGARAVALGMLLHPAVVMMMMMKRGSGTGDFVAEALDLAIVSHHPTVVGGGDVWE